ncbi:MAG: hypothetical protein HY270_11865 [Deltaproteobacteria bacterium]|nr:hypothetical protein [Deltaproteobacteria bacterium]
MDQLAAWFQFLRTNPWLVVAALGVVVGIYFALNRRTKLQRQADERFNQLREERGEIYRNLRPPT